MVGDLVFIAGAIVLTLIVIASLIGIVAITVHLIIDFPDIGERVAAAWLGCLLVASLSIYFWFAGVNAALASLRGA